MPVPQRQIAVLGAGPVGLSAAIHLLERGLTPVVLEQGERAGEAMRRWAHVRLFSPWRYIVDPVAGRLLRESGWRAPDPEALPTAGQVVEDYLEPLAALPGLAPHLRFGARVRAVRRRGIDKLGSEDRRSRPFLIGIERGEDVEAGAVIDATGTWGQPNPLGVDGLAVSGEADARARIDYGLPDVLAAARSDYAGRTILVVGGGHSAINVVLSLMELQKEAPGTRIHWALRRSGIEKLVGGGIDDQLPARGRLGLAAKVAIEAGRLTLLAPFAIGTIETRDGRLVVEARHGARAIRLELDRIVAATGFRPDLDMTRELRVALDPVVEAPSRLAPLIDPDLHSCGTVPPHGAAELAHPEEDFYMAGSKSYGRAHTFLMATGYEQVRSIAARLAGDHEAARRVELVLPQTGVCRGEAMAEQAAVDVEGACCGGPSADDPDACCVRDAKARARGEEGCGCGARPAGRTPEPAAPTAASCC